MEISADAKIYTLELLYFWIHTFYVLMFALFQSHRDVLLCPLLLFACRDDNAVCSSGNISVDVYSKVTIGRRALSVLRKYREKVNVHGAYNLTKSPTTKGASSVESLVLLVALFVVVVAIDSLTAGELCATI